MYWLPKIHKTPVGARFIVASYYCSTNPLSDTISKNFKMIFNTVESFHKKGFFYLGCKKFWVVQNSFPIATMINKINVKEKPISTFECSTFYTTTLDKLLIKLLQKLSVLCSNLKSDSTSASLKHLSIGLLWVLEEDTLPSKLLSMLYLFS